MHLEFTRTTLRVLLTGCVLLLAGAGATARAAEMKLEVQLIWGTSEAASTNANHKPVEPEVQKKLAGLPLRWSHFFEVKRIQFNVPTAASKKEALSEKCQIEVRNLGKAKVEVTLYGKGQVVLQQTQPLPKGEILVLGGNAPNATGWLVTLKRME